MPFWKRQNQSDFTREQLEESLHNAARISLPLKKQQMLKRQLFKAIKESSLKQASFKAQHSFLHRKSLHQTQLDSQNVLSGSFLELSERIQKTSGPVSLSLAQQASMKKRIFSFIRQSNSIGDSSKSYHQFRFFRTALSSALLFFFVVTSVLIFPFQVPITYAARSTYLDDVFGEVYVLRSDKMIFGKKDFVLHEGDVLITKVNSFASVRFFDDSVSRLDSNTRLSVNKLYAEPFNPIATQVELNLADGHLWSRVINLVDANSHFMVSTDQAVAFVSKKAAFDLESHVYNTTLSVFDNVVDFSVAQSYPSRPQPVLTGFQAEVGNEPNGSKLTKIVPIPSGAQARKSDSEWVASNLQKDKVHTVSLLAENQKDIADKTGMATVVENTNVSSADPNKINNPELEKDRQLFMEGYQQLLLGGAALIHHQQEDGLKRVKQFQDVLAGIMSRYPGYLKKDSFNAGLLYSFMQSKLAEQRKKVATLLPDDPLYPLKEELSNAELVLAGSDVDKTKLQLGQSEDKLLEIQELVQNSKYDMAQDVLVRYQKQISGLVLKVNSDNASEFHSNLVSFVDHQIDQIKVLTSIEKSLFTIQPAFQLLKGVRNIRQEVLEKLVATLENVDDTLPVHLVQELRDLLQTYQGTGVYDDAFVKLLNNLIVKYGRMPEKVDVPDPQALPSKVGIVTIVDGNSPSEVPHTQELLKPAAPPEVKTTPKIDTFPKTQEQTDVSKDPSVSGIGDTAVSSDASNPSQDSISTLIIDPAQTGNNDPVTPPQI